MMHEGSKGELRGSLSERSWQKVICDIACGSPSEPCGWVALSVAGGQGTELEGAASCVSRVEADICTGDGELAPACNCCRECSAESELAV